MNPFVVFYPSEIPEGYGRLAIDVGISVLDISYTGKNVSKGDLSPVDPHLYEVLVQR